MNWNELKNIAPESVTVDDLALLLAEAEKLAEDEFLRVTVIGHNGQIGGNDPFFLSRDLCDLIRDARIGVRGLISTGWTGTAKNLVSSKESFFAERLAKSNPEIDVETLGQMLPELRAKLAGMEAYSMHEIKMLLQEIRIPFFGIDLKKASPSTGILLAMVTHACRVAEKLSETLATKMPLPA